MKKIYMLIVVSLCIILLSSELKSQMLDPKWEKLNTGTIAGINGIANIGTGIIIACGDDGIIIKSVDGGESWSPKKSDVDVSFSEIKFANSKIGYIVGFKKLLKTTDSGETWKVVSTFDNRIRRLFLIDADTLYAEKYDDMLNLEYHSRLIKSMDGGESWIDKFTYSGEVKYPRFHQMFFIDNAGYIILNQKNDAEMFGKNVVYRSVDYGNTWIQLNDFLPDLPLELIHQLSILFFTTATSGAFYVDGIKISTEDGFETYKIDGNNFMNLHSPHSHSHGDYINGDFHSNGNHCLVYRYTTFDDAGLVANDVSVMRYTTDDGMSWIEGKYDYYNFDTQKIYYNTIHSVKDSTFYIGCNNGIIRSKVFPLPVNENKELNINIYPNPMTSELRIMSKEFKIETIEIFNVIWERIIHISTDSSDGVTINVADLKTGIYFIRIVTEQGSVIKKITKQ